MNPIRITNKEARRASNGLTVVVRPQPSRQFMVAIVRVATGLPVFPPSFVERSGVSRAIGEDLRMIDKCGYDCPMASASRTRNFCN